MMMKNLNNHSSVVITQIPRKKQFYKTKICPWFFSGRCDRGVDCLFAHSQEELNPIPDLSFTSLCPIAKKSGLCKNEKCSYAHSVCELRPTGDLYKTAPCNKFLRGKCNAEEHCRHAHFIEELRPLPGNLSPSQNAINLMLSSSLSNPLQKSNKKNNFMNNEKKNEKILKQSNSLICNFSSQSNRKYPKKFLKNASADNINITANNNLSINNYHNNNYQKSSSFPNKMYPLLLKNKTNNAECNEKNSLNFKNYIISSNNIEDSNKNMINSFSMNLLHTPCNKNNEFNVTYKSLNEIRTHGNMNNTFYNVNKNINVEAVNHYSSFSTKEPSTPMRMSSSSSKDYTSNHEDNNIADTIEHMEITAQDSALKVIEDDSEKLNCSDIKNFLNLLQIKNSNNYSKDHFLFKEGSSNDNSIYVPYKLLPTSRNNLESNRIAENQYSQDHLNANIYKVNSDKQQINISEQSNSFNNLYKLNNNSLISCSNFWNYADDELSNVTSKIAQKVEVLEY